MQHLADAKHIADSFANPISCRHLNHRHHGIGCTWTSHLSDSRATPQVVDWQLLAATHLADSIATSLLTNSLAAPYHVDSHETQSFNKLTVLTSYKLRFNTTSSRFTCNVTFYRVKSSKPSFKLTCNSISCRLTCSIISCIITWIGCQTRLHVPICYEV